MNRKWTRDETIIAFNVYCKIPFKESSSTNPLIIKYAQILGRTPSALNMKVGNIGRLDPDLKKKGITGLVHGAKMEEEVWKEFYGNPSALAYESEKLIAEFSKRKIEDSSDIEVDDLPKGEEREMIVKQRVNQAFFRSVVLSSYDFQCCISGVRTPELLEACHIVDWSSDSYNRTNPKNGLCMNPFFHEAYDKNLLGITPDLEIKISDKLLENSKEEHFFNYLNKINGRKISLPNKFFPDKDLLAEHYSCYIMQDGN